MRISDWSSDVCSADLLDRRRRPAPIFINSGIAIRKGSVVKLARESRRCRHGSRRRMVTVDQLATAAGKRGLDALDGEMPAPIARPAAEDWHYGRVEGLKTAAPSTKDRKSTRLNSSP